MNLTCAVHIKISCASSFFLNHVIHKFLNPLLYRLFLDHDIIFFFKITLKKNQEKIKLTFEYFFSVNKSFNPDQVLHLVMPDLGSNQLQKLSVGDKAVISMERVKIN